MKPSDKSIRAMGVTLICQYLIKECCLLLKEDNRIQPERLKKNIDTLVTNAQYVINQVEDLKHLQKISKEISREIEIDDVKDDISVQCSIVRNIANLMLMSDAAETDELALILDNFKNGKRTYTEEELQYAVKQGINNYWQLKQS